MSGGKRSQLKKPPRRTEKWTTFQVVFSCAVITASASFTHGYGIGAHNQFAPYVEATLGRAANGSIAAGLPQFLFTLGNFAGAFTAVHWTRVPCFSGSRRVFYANLPFTFVSVGLVLGSFYRRSYPLYVASRFVHGYQGGMACAVVPPFLIDLAPMGMRGAAGTLHQLAVTVGILSAQLAGIPRLLGTERLWHFGFAVGGLTSLVAFGLIAFLSDSPAEALAKGEQEAEEVLRRLRGKEDVGRELRELKAHSRAFAAATAERSPRIWTLFKSDKYRWPLIISITLLGGQALCGINAIFYYSDYIFRKAGIRADKRPYCIFMTGVFNLVATMAAMKLLDMWGRRTLIVWPCTIMIAVFALLPVLIKLNASHHIRMLAWISVLLVLVYVACFAVGMGPIPYIYASEVFKHDDQHIALVAGLLINYTCNAIVSITFPALNNALGGYVFLVFMVIMVVQTTAYYFKMAETKGKSFEEIDAFWSRKPSTSNKTQAST